MNVLLIGERVINKKIFQRPQGDGIFIPFNDIVFEFFQTKDKECIYSKGYPGGINFEYYPNKKQLNILYPFPTFKELTDLGIEFYTEHAYGPRWIDIEPDLDLIDSSFGPDVGELRIEENLHESLIDYFVSELRTKEGLSSYMFSEFSHFYIENFPKDPEKNLEKLNDLFLPYEKDGWGEDFDGILYCEWKVEKKFNKSGYLDILVSIQLPKYHNEICKILCSKTEGFNIYGLFGYCNGIDGRTDDGQTYGVYSNLNFEKDYILRNYQIYEIEEGDDEVQFPWTRLGK